MATDSTYKFGCAFYCLHAVLPGMLERRDGVVINISSVAGERAWPLSGLAYNASKFGMTAAWIMSWGGIEG